MDPFGIASKLFGASIAASTRVVKSVSSPFKSSSSAPSINAKVVKLQDCPEEFDEKQREAQFAIRTTDLGSWQTSSSSSSSRSGQGSTNSDPKAIQHWALVVYFPRGELIYLFEAWKDENGQLEAGRAKIAFEDIAVFEEADYIGTAVTSPCQLLEKAKQITGGEYNVLLYNCQTWIRIFLFNINFGSNLNLPLKYQIGITN